MSDIKYCKICGQQVPKNTPEIIGIGNVCEDCLFDFMEDEHEDFIDRVYNGDE